MAHYNFPILLAEHPNLFERMNVKSLTFSPNQARVLVIEHVSKFDTTNVLAVNDTIKYTDPDLGECFNGKIVEIRKALESGEGIEYVASDAYRLLSKTVAQITISGKQTSQLGFAEGSTVKNAIDKIMAKPIAEGLFGATNIVGVPLQNTALPALDKGGQTIDTWIEDILKNTTAIAYVNPTLSVPGGKPYLKIVDYNASDPVELTIGSYNVINPRKWPIPNHSVLVDGGNSVNQTINNKYRRICWEGSGIFERKKDQSIIGVTTDVGTPNVALYKFRIPGGYKPLKTHVDADGNCISEGFNARITISGPDIVTPYEHFYPNPPIAKDSVGWYFSLALQTKIYPLIGPPHLAGLVTGLFDYTIYTGPYVVCSSDPGNPNGEGEIFEVHNEYFKYEGAGTDQDIDHTAEIQDYLDNVFTKYDGIDLTGTFNIHIHGINTELTLGSAITNAVLSLGILHPRVRNISYDLIGRNMTLEVSSLPIRDFVGAIKLNLRDKTLLGSQNWHQNKVSGGKEGGEGCFSGITILNGDPNETEALTGGDGSGGVNGVPGSEGSGGTSGGHGGFPSSGPTRCYGNASGDCWAESVAPQGEGCPDGSFATRNECLTAQEGGGWYCVDTFTKHCVPGGVANMGTGWGYRTAGACQAGCAGLYIRFICDSMGVRQVYVENEFEGFPTFNDACLNCAAETAKGTVCGAGNLNVNMTCPDGQYPMGVQYDPRGKPIKPICLPTVDIAVVTDIECDADGTLHFTTRLLTVLKVI